MAAYAVLFAFAAVVHYLAFRSARFDLGDMVQPIWNTAHGHFLETTTLNGHQADRLGFHVDPFLLLFVPLFWIWSSPVLLPVVQVVAVVSGALPVYWLARKHLDSSRAGVHFALAYLLYPATQFNVFTLWSDFHPVSFAVPLVLYAVWFLDEDRPVAFSVVALLAATTKEEIPLALGCLGLWYAYRKRHRLLGLGMFAVGLGLTMFNFLWLIPHFAPSGVNPYAGRYTSVGGTPQGMAHKLVTDPAVFVHAAASGQKALYLGLLFVPFLGLWVLEPLLLLGAVPDLAINLLASRTQQTSITFQGTAGIVPFLVAASIFGCSRFKRQAASASFWALACVASTMFFSPLLMLTNDAAVLGSSRADAIDHALHLIPAAAPVSATNHLGAYLSERRYIYTFPHLGRSKWAIVDLQDPTPYWDARTLRQHLRRYESDKNWRVVFSSHGIVVLYRRPAARR